MLLTYCMDCGCILEEDASLDCAHSNTVQVSGRPMRVFVDKDLMKEFDDEYAQDEHGHARNSNVYTDSSGS